MYEYSVQLYFRKQRTLANTSWRVTIKTYCSTSQFNIIVEFTSEVGKWYNYHRKLTWIDWQKSSWSNWVIRWSELVPFHEFCSKQNSVNSGGNFFSTVAHYNNEIWVLHDDAPPWYDSLKVWQFLNTSLLFIGLVYVWNFLISILKIYIRSFHW